VRDPVALQPGALAHAEHHLLLDLSRVGVAPFPLTNGME